MSEWDHLKTELNAGSISRRAFLGRAAMLGISTALATQALAQTPKRGGHLIAGVDQASSGDSLDPARYTTVYMALVGAQFYDTLTVVDENLKVQPALAESWTTKPGAKEWVLKIRKGVTFHNGKELTASDVVYSINHHRRPESKSAARALWQR